MRNSVYKNNLNESYFNELTKIFKEKNWDINDIEVENIFNNFCQRLIDLKSDEKRELILDLTKRYEWIKFDVYESYLLDAFKQLFSSKEWKLFWKQRKPGKNICITSLNDNPNITKSGSIVLYLIQSFVLRVERYFANEQIRLFDNFEVLNKHKNQFDVIIYVDDYIGSGLSVLSGLNKIKDINCEKYIVCLAAQQEGIDLIKTQTNINVYAKLIRNKGISDNYDENVKKHKLDLMKQISQELNAGTNNLLGYHDSEALISLIRTPNNTFPVFWLENKNYGNAPFSRKTNIKFVKE